MARKLKLQAEIIVDDKGSIVVKNFSDTMTKASKNADKSNKKIETGMGGIGGALSSVTGLVKGFAGAWVFTKGVQQVGKLISASSNLKESVNAVNVIFGEGAETILSYGETAAESVGLANSEFNQLSTVTGALLKNTGRPLSEVADLTIDLTERAADLASVFNKDVNVAMSAINQAIRGETEAIRAFAGDVTDATLQQYLMSQGIQRSVKDLTEQEKRLYRVRLILQQTKDVQGDFAETQGETANQARIAAATVKDVWAKAGSGVEKAWGGILGIFNKLTQSDFSKIQGNLQQLNEIFNQGSSDAALLEQTKQQVGIYQKYRDALKATSDAQGDLRDKIKDVNDQLSRDLTKKYQRQINDIADALRNIRIKNTFGDTQKTLTGLFEAVEQGTTKSDAFERSLNSVARQALYLGQASSRLETVAAQGINVDKNKKAAKGLLQIQTYLLDQLTILENAQIAQDQLNQKQQDQLKIAQQVRDLVGNIPMLDEVVVVVPRFDERIEQLKFLSRNITAIEVEAGKHLKDKTQQELETQRTFVQQIEQAKISISDTDNEILLKLLAQSEQTEQQKQLQERINQLASDYGIELDNNLTTAQLIEQTFRQSADSMGHVVGQMIRGKAEAEDLVKLMIKLALKAAAIKFAGPSGPAGVFGLELLGGIIGGLNTGGLVNFGSPANRDSVLASLTRGEFVLNRNATEQLGVGDLSRANRDPSSFAIVDKAMLASLAQQPIRPVPAFSQASPLANGDINVNINRGAVSVDPVINQIVEQSDRELEAKIDRYIREKVKRREYNKIILN